MTRDEIIYKLFGEEQEAVQDVERVVELHQMLADQNPDLPNNFFKPSSK